MTNVDEIVIVNTERRFYPVPDPTTFPYFSLNQKIYLGVFTSLKDSVVTGISIANPLVPVGTGTNWYIRWGPLLTLKDVRGKTLLYNYPMTDLQNGLVTNVPASGVGNDGKHRQFNLERVDTENSYVLITNTGSLFNMPPYWLSLQFESKPLVAT